MTEGAADVLIIGAGPSGLFAAAELARHGHRARVVERDLAPHRQARATALQPGTLEILASAGLVEEALSSSVHVGFARLYDGSLNLIGEVDFAGAGAPWEHQCSLPQWRTEEILTKRLMELGGSVEHGTAAVSIDQHDDRVLVRLERATGETENAEAQWVIGAGGAHSLMRSSMDEDLVGGTYPGTALAADIRVRTDLKRDASTLIASRHGYVLLAPLPDDRWITFVGDLDEQELEHLDEETAREMIAPTFARRLGETVAVEDVGWASPFRMHHRVVSHLVDRRCFLLGDAGHLTSPFGGEGLNTGLWDAHNLAWKLALDARGSSRPGLLKSYGIERLAASRHALEVSDELHRVAKEAVEAQRTGNSPAPPTPEQAHALIRSRSMLDVSYDGSPLVGEHLDSTPRRTRIDGAGPCPGERYPDRTELQGTNHHLLLFGAADSEGIARLRDRWRGLVEIEQCDRDPARAGLPGEGAALIRPDGHIGFCAAPADTAGLDALDAHLASYLIPY